MQRILVTQAILWAAAIFVNAIAAGEAWWLLVILAAVGMMSLKRDIDKIASS